MNDRIRFLLNRIGERLWVRPLIICALSICGAFLARAADTTGLDLFIPEITPDSIETLLKIISTSMLVIATFAVTSMISAYSSASTTATPRSFALVIADDVSQNALSTFIGAFIFSIVALIALMNGYYEKAGRFTLFALTLFVFVVVIITFVRWVDRIARLGRLGTTIDKVETATAKALLRRRCAPTLRGLSARPVPAAGQAIYGSTVGYVQRVDVAMLQTYAEEAQIRIRMSALPGTFSAPGQVLAYLTADSGELSDIDSSRIEQAFIVGNKRTFDEDPRFGLIVLSEIASRALSPAVNDPGTAIEVIGSFVRLFTRWSDPLEEREKQTVECDRVEVPEINLMDMFDDAFNPLARDGAATLEVAVRLQKALRSLTQAGDERMRKTAIRHSRLALARAENALTLPEDLQMIRDLAGFSDST